MGQLYPIRKYQLDKMQNEAARNAKGSTSLISINSLYKEVGWESLAVRRNKHMICLFYKMSNNLTPSYLSSLVPVSVGKASRYNLRSSNDLQNIDGTNELKL